MLGLLAGAATADGRIPARVTVTADDTVFDVTVRLDTAREATCYRHGALMPYVLRTICRQDSVIAARNHCRPSAPASTADHRAGHP
ncbi:hypothetical protein [Micromonospora sp. NPDC006431]|uniref:hypothetical protein n=1 Tax=Micromonospora sp. NPDC006431 TaxID=3364235 RepID=UPI0036C3B4EE